MVAVERVTRSRHARTSENHVTNKVGLKKSNWMRLKLDVKLPYQIIQMRMRTNKKQKKNKKETPPKRTKKMLGVN